MRAKPLARALLVTLASLVSAPAFAVPSDEAIRQILVQRVDGARQATGIVVGIVDPAGRRIVAHGALSATDPRVLDGNTVFEIGSVTKVFTSLLLAEMARRGEVSLEEPVAALLPRGAMRVAESDGRTIRLVDLATHTSGLPGMPPDFKPDDFGNPYGDYSVEQGYAFLSGYSPARAPGTRFDYSNFGAGLLGHALALRAGKSYEALLRERITGPLKLADTGVVLAPTLTRRLAVGHGWALTPVDPWTSTALLTGAGFLRSTANDLLTLLESFIGLRDSTLAPAMKAMLATRRSGGIPPAANVGLGWMLGSVGPGEIVWHPGRTSGYLSFMGYDPATRTGVVVLANANTRVGIIDIGLHLLDAQAPLADPRPPRLDPSALDMQVAERLTGRYQWRPGLDLDVTREGGRLFLQAGSPRKFELLPDADGSMLMKETLGSVSFDLPMSDGPARAVNVRLFGGRDHYRAWRVD